jgi:hypothetical protein
VVLLYSPTEVDKVVPLVSYILATLPTPVWHYVGTHRICRGSAFKYTQSYSNTAPLTPLHHRSNRHYTIFENSGIFATANVFFFVVPSGQISVQNHVCQLHSLGYRAQVLCLELLHRPNTIIGFSIMLPNGSVWVTEPHDPTDFLFHPFEGWCIGSVLIVVWDWDEPPKTFNCILSLKQEEASIHSHQNKKRNSHQNKERHA